MKCTYIISALILSMGLQTNPSRASADDLISSANSAVLEVCFNKGQYAESISLWKKSGVSRSQAISEVNASIQHPGLRELFLGAVEDVYDPAVVSDPQVAKKRTFDSCLSKYKGRISKNDPRPNQTICTLHYSTLFMVAKKLGRADLLSALQFRLRKIYPSVAAAKGDQDISALFKIQAGLKSLGIEKQSADFESAILNRQQALFDNAMRDIRICDMELEFGDKTPKLSVLP